MRSCVVTSGADELGNGIVFQLLHNEVDVPESVVGKRDHFNAKRAREKAVPCPENGKVKWIRLFTAAGFFPGVAVLTGQGGAGCYWSGRRLGKRKGRLEAGDIFAEVHFLLGDKSAGAGNLFRGGDPAFRALGERRGPGKK